MGFFFYIQTATTNNHLQQPDYIMMSFLLSFLYYPFYSFTQIYIYIIYIISFSLLIYIYIHTPLFLLLHNTQHTFFIIINIYKYVYTVKKRPRIKYVFFYCNIYSTIKKK
ncbi:MAG: hypothetical protein EXX96DRAFT_584168 [Benjaminiella poitrasii]|nr:MAG: hypothetical protein EXX96DRAFT_584168 [Benjaminiella poitrasii]